MSARLLGFSPQWLSGTLILPVYVDPSCGDAICQGPFEYIAWGRGDHLHGCAPDCGFRSDLTTTLVSLDYSEPTTNGPGTLPAYFPSCAASAVWNVQCWPG